MNVKHPLALLGGLTPSEFMQRHWQRKPLLVRQAIANFSPLVTRPELFELAAQEGVESRFVPTPSVEETRIGSLYLLISGLNRPPKLPTSEITPLVLVDFAKRL